MAITVSIPASPTATPTATLTVAPTPEALTALVTPVVDGDTVDVVFEDGTSDRVRLLGVDTPDTLLANRPNEYEEITDVACLGRWGSLATGYAAQELEGQTVTLVLDPAAGERGSFGRVTRSQYGRTHHTAATASTAAEDAARTRRP